MNYPEWKPGPYRVPGLMANDTLRKGGAEALAREIRWRWREAGWDINVWVEKMYQGGYAVRSDLINGVPRPDAVKFRPKANIIVW